MFCVNWYLTLVSDSAMLSPESVNATSAISILGRNYWTGFRWFIRRFSIVVDMGVRASKIEKLFLPIGTWNFRANCMKLKVNTMCHIRSVSKRDNHTSWKWTGDMFGFVWCAVNLSTHFACVCQKTYVPLLKIFIFIQGSRCISIWFNF